MRAGRELDGLVAKHVMHDVPGQVWDREYSTDIRAAWTVMQRLGADGWNCRLEYPGWGRKGSTKVEITRGASDKGGFFRYEIIDKPFPEAVCLAALKAVGVEV